ncbi:MAG: copper chaperone PCu(A)C [Alphaproteobacteria bacterium]|nr:copper chaperone PCu(A)C [Alphaproteobacteria bacterium]
MIDPVRRSLLCRLGRSSAGLAVAFGLALGLVLAGPGGAAGAEFNAGTMRVHTPVAFSTPAAARNGAAYLIMQNRGSAADRLMSASTPAAARVELHSTVTEGGVMKMRPLTAIDIPAGGTVRLQRGGQHVMLLDLREPLKAGASFPLTLVFEKAGALEVTVNVEPVRGTGGHHH